MKQHENTREKMVAITNWLAHQHESLSYGLKIIQDAEKLYDYWQNNTELPEYADALSDDEGVDVAAARVAAVGYDPLFA